MTGAQLRLKAASPSRYCTGRYTFTQTFHVQPVTCPDRAQAARGGQCDRCSQRDEFRLAHHAHRSSLPPPALAAYLSQPHWLYLATFAHGLTKVGTAAAPRRRSRLDEQAAMCATYLAQAPNGTEVRVLEDAVSQQMRLPQTSRTTAKAHGLLSPDPSRMRELHEQAIAEAVNVLAGLGIAADPQPWCPPADSIALLSPPATDARSPYPHDLREGQHGFTIKACAGSVALISIAGHHATQYVIDLSRLEGRRVTFGDYASPPASIQTLLF